MKSILRYKILIIAAGFLMAAKCESDDSPITGGQEVNYTIVNNGDGGVNFISDTGDQENLEIVQAVPPNSDITYPNNIPIILFFDDKIYLNSLQGNFHVYQNGEEVGGTVTINEGANGYAILTFQPSSPFLTESSIQIVISGELQDDGGNFLSQDEYVLEYQTNNQNNGFFDDNLNFENGYEGVLFLGDGNILEGTIGCLAPYSGNKMAAITSGVSIVSDHEALDGASSYMILGSINSNFSKMKFHYNFMSSEFQEYVNSEFDDSVIISIIGPDGSKSEFLTSVNTVGTEQNTQCINFPGMPDVGDNYAGVTGWKEVVINNLNVGTPAYVIFTITDVADTAYSSLLAIDNLTLD